MKTGHEERAPDAHDKKAVMENYKSVFLLWALIFTAGLSCWFVPIAMADDDHGFRWPFERERRHRTSFWDPGDEANETAGQIAAWLLLVANLPVAFSLLVKYANRFAPLQAKWKKITVDLNRIQKKAFMWLHYYLNPAILAIALWHWLSSRCKSTALPELGLILMGVVVALGIFIKFKLGSRNFRKLAFQIHTQPVLSISMFLVLTIGHLLVH